MAKSDVKLIIEKIRKLSLDEKYLIVNRIVKETPLGDSLRLSEEQKNWIKFAGKASKEDRKLYTRNEI